MARNTQHVPDFMQFYDVFVNLYKTITFESLRTYIMLLQGEKKRILRSRFNANGDEPRVRLVFGL